METEAQQQAKKPFLGILFECCHVYSRVYKKDDAQIYEGRCPKCLRALSVRVDPEKGVQGRFFKAR